MVLIGPGDFRDKDPSVFLDHASCRCVKVAWRVLTCSLMPPRIPKFSCATADPVSGIEGAVSLPNATNISQRHGSRPCHPRRSVHVNEPSSSDGRSTVPMGCPDDMRVD